MIVVVVVVLVVVYHLFPLSEKTNKKTKRPAGVSDRSDTCVTSLALQSILGIDGMAPSDWLTGLLCLHFLFGIDCKDLIGHFVL